MGWTRQGQIGPKLKGAKLNSEYNTSFKVSNINTGLIEYSPKIFMKK